MKARPKQSSAVVIFCRPCNWRVGTPNTDDDRARHFLLSAYMLKLLTYDVIALF
jgi:hypothetical protein